MLFDFPKGNTAANNALTLPLGVISVDTQAKNLRVHDGATAGGHASKAATTPT